MRRGSVSGGTLGLKEWTVQRHCMVDGHGHVFCQSIFRKSFGRKTWARLRQQGSLFNAGLQGFRLSRIPALTGPCRCWDQGPCTPPGPDGSFSLSLSLSRSLSLSLSLTLSPSTGQGRFPQPDWPQSGRRTIHLASRHVIQVY